MTVIVDGSVHPGFGGPWTKKKLGILEKYLDAYTTALKNQSFQLVYVDAFAGTGQIMTKSGPGHEIDKRDSEAFIFGSVQRALQVTDRPFDRLVFVEKYGEHYEELCELPNHHPSRRIEVRQQDANQFLCDLSKKEFGNWRGVLFIDPFGTQLEWNTLQRVARLERLDTWILFPVGAIARMLPLSGNPADMSSGWKEKLNTVFGDGSWRNLYSPPLQGSLFGNDTMERDRGVDGLLSLYKDRLRTTFGDRLLDESRQLTNSKNSRLFEFIFCAGHPDGTPLAKRIAKHLVNNDEF